jgi:magnesium-protoporphyrin O-methyltransferase
LKPNLVSNFVQAKEQLQAGNENVVPVMPKFEVKDLESLDGKYDTVVCLDVLII